MSERVIQLALHNLIVTCGYSTNGTVSETDTMKFALRLNEILQVALQDMAGWQSDGLAYDMESAIAVELAKLPCDAPPAKL